MASNALRWVCGSGNPEDLDKTDEIACEVLEEMSKNSPVEIRQQMQDNIQWIQGAKANKLVVGSQARILYADAEGRMRIAAAFNKAIADGKIGRLCWGAIIMMFLELILHIEKHQIFMMGRSLRQIWPSKM